MGDRRRRRRCAITSSSDATITTSDTEVGTGAVAELAATGTRSQSVELVAPSTPGTYHYGACVDAVADESDTTNNCSASVPVTVPEPRRPDLLVTLPSSSDGRPVTGTSFTLSATVRNDGDGTAAATTLRYYRSTDATITTSDREVGTGAVAELAAAGSGSQSVDLVAPSTQGTYYYGACVDAVADESDRTNNCSPSVEVSVQVTVKEPQGYPDLMVTSRSVSDRLPVTGTSFRLSATVSNDGDGTAAATTLRYYRSTDATITTSDTEVGTNAIAGLGAEGSSSGSVDVTAPATAGAYYYGACVDAVTDESDTTNNCSAAMQVDVEEPKYPDLEVGTPTVDDASPQTGATFTLSATVSNAGDARSAAATLRYYRSTDATITTSDTPVGTDSVGALAASGTSAESISVTAPATAGAYHYGACVDAVTDESDTTDNARRRCRWTWRSRSILTWRWERRRWTTRARRPGRRSRRSQHGRRKVGGDDAALLPIDGRDDHDVGRAGGDGLRRRAGGVGDERGVDLGDGACDGGCVPLRGVRGRGDR